MNATSSAEIEDGENLLVDVDVHQTWSSADEFLQYLPDHFRDRGITAPGDPGWMNPIAVEGLGRTDAVPEDGGTPGSSFSLLEEQLFDDFGVDYAVLTGPLTQARLAKHPNYHYAKACVEAYNDWLIEEWLKKDERLLGSIIISPQAPQHAVDEIQRVGSHGQVAQVMFPGANPPPCGHEMYWPIYEAAEDAGLPIAMHAMTGSAGLGWAPSSAAGIPLSYPERHMGAMGTLTGDLTSLVFEGVFVEYPDLKWVFLEGGLAWIPHFLWKMDKLWKGVRESIPWLDSPPSQYIRENIRFSTQPIEEPEKREHLAQLFDMIHADETVVFSTDYPHWDNDNPKAVLNSISPDTRRKVFTENALELYDI